jgi:hypothetical protein
MNKRKTEKIQGHEFNGVDDGNNINFLYINYCNIIIKNGGKEKEIKASNIEAKV